MRSLFKNIGVVIAISFFFSCVSIPKESITLSETLGSDLKVLHNSHRNLVNLHFQDMRDNINRFVDDKYAPFVIHFVLSKELNNYNNGVDTTNNLYGAIIKAGKVKGKAESENALNQMTDFLEAARRQIEKKRTELLKPINQQYNQVLNQVNKSYDNAIYANSTLTGYLRSARKVRDAQQEALKLVGLPPDLDSTITNNVVKLSDLVKEAVDKGNEIDTQSDDAYQKLEEISKKIKAITSKKQK